MAKLNIDIKDHKFKELLTYWRKIIGERLRRRQYYNDPRYGMLVLTRREFLKLLVSLGIAGAIATLGIGMFNAHWLWAQETTNPPPTPAQYNYGELNWLELTVRGTPLGEGLVGEWLFFEGTGTTLHDTSGFSNHGTIYSPLWRLLPNGKYYLEFTGSNYVDIPNSSTINFSGKDKLTLEVITMPKQWMRGPQWTIVRFASNQYLLEPGDAGPNRYRFFIQGQKTRHFIDTVQLEPNKWWHIIGRYWGSGMDLYVNDTFNSSATFEYDKISNQTGHLRFGVWASEKYIGCLALVRLWEDKIPRNNITILFKLAKIAVPYIGS